MPPHKDLTSKQVDLSPCDGIRIERKRHFEQGKSAFDLSGKPCRLAGVSEAANCLLSGGRKLGRTLQRAGRRPVAATQSGFVGRLFKKTGDIVVRTEAGGGEMPGA